MYLFNMKLFLFVTFINNAFPTHTSTPDPENDLIRVPLTRYQQWDSESAFRFQEKHEILLVNHENLGYYGPISIGTPPVEMNVLFDTGAPWLWFCPKLADIHHPSTENRTLYNHSLSQTFRISEERDNPFLFKYISRFYFGNWSSETFTINGVQIHNQSFIEVEYDTELLTYPFDGIVGLNLKPENDSSAEIISQFCQQKGINESIFSFHLTNNLTDKNGGELILCGIDSSKYSGELNYVNEIDDPDYSWMIRVDKVTINYAEGRNEVLNIVNYNTAHVDSGASYICGPVHLIEYINTVIDTAEFKPNITFTISNKDYIITAKDYMLQIADVQPFAGFHELHQSNWILGDVFLRKYYTVYDLKNHRVGFAESL